MPPPTFKEIILQLVWTSPLSDAFLTNRGDINVPSQKEIMASYDSSLVIVSGATTVPGSDFRETLDAMIDPLLQICDIGAEKLSPYDRLVYKTNCLQYARVRMTRFCSVM